MEIGALRGDTTASLLESLGAGAQLHVIDPVPQFDPAEHEGGPRNGVRTAVDDFLAKDTASFRLVVLELCSGLAVLGSTGRIARHPGLAGFLDRLGTEEEQTRVAAKAEAAIREAAASGNLKLS